MGGRQGRPRVRPKKGVGSLSRRRFRAALANTTLLNLAAAPCLAADPDLAAAAPKREGTRPPRPRPPPKDPPWSQRGPNTAYMRRYREAEENFLGVGWSILGVGCLYGFGRWVAQTIRWALDGVGCLWRRRWVVLEHAERRRRGLPGCGRQRGPLDLERSTGGV